MTVDTDLSLSQRGQIAARRERDLTVVGRVLGMRVFPTVLFVGGVPALAMDLCFSV